MGTKAFQVVHNTSSYHGCLTEDRGVNRAHQGGLLVPSVADLNPTAPKRQVGAGCSYRSKGKTLDVE